MVYFYILYMEVVKLATCKHALMVHTNNTLNQMRNFNVKKPGKQT